MLSENDDFDCSVEGYTHSSSDQAQLRKHKYDMHTYEVQIQINEGEQKKQVRAI